MIENFKSVNEGVNVAAEFQETSGNRVSNFKVMAKAVLAYLRQIDKEARELQESMDHPENFGLKVR